MKKILFILKKRNIYSDGNYASVNSGLYNSATFVNDMLLKNNVETNIVQVNDNNEIDKYCHQYKPDIVIIEALWVVPEKFEILQKLHPGITWVIRLHSELPFLANEGIAIEWLKRYVQYENVRIGSNSKYLIEALTPLLDSKLVYLPNYYKVNSTSSNNSISSGKLLNVGIFGAIRPLKNTLTQAVASINYANSVKKKLVLHVNSARVEQKGENVLKNLRALFVDTPHVLVEHGWLNHKDFTQLVSTMDICLQVSLTETYNIVAADAINQNVPVVTSREITFVNWLSSVESNKDVVKLIETIDLTLKLRYMLTKVNKLLLNWDSNKSKRVWLKFVK
jgi:hypothetical protein